MRTTRRLATHVALMPHPCQRLHTIVTKAAGGGKFTMRVDLQCGSKMGAMLGVLCIASALLWSSATKAETHVYLLRGWFVVGNADGDPLSERKLRCQNLSRSSIATGAAVALASCPSPSMILPDARSLPHGLAQLPEKLGRSGVAASRAWDWIITHPIGTTQGRPRHDLWTKLR